MSRVTVSADGLQLGTEYRPLRTAEVHYWRLDPADWPAVLDTVVALRFNGVSSYLPWSRHERGPGRYDFVTGALDLRRFLDLLSERDLTFTARVGPNCGAELEDSGWPRRVLDDPRCQARRPDGRPYLLPTSVHYAFMPSFGSRQTLHEVGLWYDAVAEQLVTRQWPDGPVVALHVDNEMGYHFQAHAFALDYHPDTLRQWTEFLQDRYGSVVALNAAWGTALQRFDDAAAPRDGRDRPEQRRLDWVRFREHHLRRSIGELAGMLRARGLGRVPFVHNDYPRMATPLDPGGLERSGAVDVAAGDVYATKSGGRYVRDYARHLATNSRLPFLAELGLGWLTLPWLFPMAVTPADVEHTIWRAWSGGIRASNMFMAVDRDRWYGGAADATGRVRPEIADLVRRANGLVAHLELARLRRDARVLVLENREEGRRAAARAIHGELVPAYSQVLPLDRRLFDGRTDEQDALQRWAGSVSELLDRDGVDYDLGSTAALPDLATYSVVVLPVVDLLDRESAAALLDAAARGTIVIAGPGRGPFSGRPEIVDGADVPALAAMFPRPVFRAMEPNLDLVRLVGDAREVLIAHNASALPLKSEVHTDRPARLIGHWVPDDIQADTGLTLELGPWGVQVFEVRR